MYRFMLIFTLLITGGAMAQEYNCKNPQYQQEMNYCAYQSFLFEDEKTKCCL